MSTTEHEVRAQLVHMLSMRGNVVTLEDNLLTDYAKIGSFLTNQGACRVYLKRLNDALVARLRELGMVEERADVEEGQSQFTLKTQPQLKTKHILKKSTYYDEHIVKHNKVLSGYFTKWESDHGFNQGTNQLDGERLPSRPATLTDFVHANDFRNYLLRHGYHWKDAGVGGSHGEFTHRIHWYMICEKLKDSPEWLSTNPVNLFKTLCEPKTINVAFKWTPTTPRVSVWDQIVDNGDNCYDLNLDGARCPHSEKPNVFRKPENLHKFIQDERDKPDLWALGYLIWGRTQKRKNESAQSLRDRYQTFIKKNMKTITRAGLKTGGGSDSLGTIIWK